MTLRIIPFQRELIPQAAELLALRHVNDRRTFPALPARFESPKVTQKAIEATLKRKHARGFAALNDGQLAAYLIGDMVIDSVWGRSGWVRMAGCAYDLTGDSEIVRDLYAALGAHWVDAGVFYHAVLAPMSDSALTQAWFSLSFGIEQVHGLCDLNAIDLDKSVGVPNVEIRQAGLADRQQMADMSDVIWRTQVEAPVWGVMMPEAVAETAAGWGELVDDAEVTAWLASLNGETVAVQGLWPAEQSDDNLLIPENCLHLSVAGTREKARGKGIGTLLTKHGLKQARVAGYRYCEADWRSTNLLASRFWPRQGFRPIVYRLVRRIDSRVIWANGVLK